MDFPHNFADLIQYLFYAVSIFLGTRAVKSIEALNIKMGVMIEKSKWHDREIKRLDNQKMDKRND